MTNTSSKKLYVYEGELYYGMKRLGDVLVNDDGYYVWWPVLENRGYLDAKFLKDVAEVLDTMNKDWHTSLTADLEKSRDDED